MSDYDQRCCGCNSPIHLPGGSVCKLGQQQCPTHPSNADSCAHCGHPKSWHGKEIRPEPPCPICGATDKWDHRAGTFRFHDPFQHESDQ